jgi:anti-sigma regulatory factor (Ser/Thr protein kinase)
MADTLKLQLATSRESIAQARAALTWFCAGVAAIASDQLTDIRLAVTEACTQLVLESEAARNPAPLMLEARETRDGLTVVVRGQGVRLGGCPPPLGERVIRLAADRVLVTSPDGTHTLIAMHCAAT